ncbi:hypothetical protein D3C71_1996090 [compost metagenome]
MQGFQPAVQVFCLNGCQQRLHRATPCPPPLRRHAGVNTPIPTSPRLRRAPLTRGGSSPGSTRNPGQEKSRLANQAASVLVGCQGFEPWTY